VTIAVPRGPPVLAGGFFGRGGASRLHGLGSQVSVSAVRSGRFLWFCHLGQFPR